MIKPSPQRRRWIIAAAALCLGVQPNPSAAQLQRTDPWGGPGNYEPGFERAVVILGQCLERAQSTPDMWPDNCVHAVFRACEAEHGNMSQRDLNECAHFSQRAWEKRLDAALSMLLGAQTLDPKYGRAEPEVERLRESQERWRQWNEADCELQAGDKEGGGTMRPMQLGLCLSNHAAHRALELEALIFWWDKSFKL